MVENLNAGQGSDAPRYQLYQKDASDTLFSVAYDHVPAGASKEAIQQCMANIQDANDFDFESKSLVKIPIPCEGDRQPATFDLESTAQNLADVFRTGTKYDAAQALSQQLTGLVDTLGTDDRLYNKLMVKIYENLKDSPDSNVNIATEGWNEQTHTWKKAYVYDSDYPRQPAVAIVQPGTTVSSLAAERADQLKNLGFYNVSTRDIASQMVAINNLQDANKISVGGFLYLPY